MEEWEVLSKRDSGRMEQPLCVVIGDVGGRVGCTMGVLSSRRGGAGETRGDTGGG